ncbi:MAG TPA: hypothetical protein VMG09_05850 [Bacteroidota bacterium]|nr:hypothetical protein [Bacteroidota bacterium]
MKTALLVATLCAASSLAFAQGKAAAGSSSYDESKYANKAVTFDRAVKNLAWCLGQENEGVVKSALYHLVRIRVANPQYDLAGAESKIKRLVEAGETPMVRYEAFLAGSVMDNPGLISVSDCETCNPPDKLFSTVAIRLHDANFGPAGPTYSSAR